MASQSHYSSSFSTKNTHQNPQTSRASNLHFRQMRSSFFSSRKREKEKERNIRTTYIGLNIGVLALISDTRYRATSVQRVKKRRVDHLGDDARCLSPHPSPSPSPVCVMEYVVYASTRFTNVFIIKDGRTLSLEMWLLSWLRCYDIVLLSYQVWNRMSCLTWKRREWKTWSKVIENKERTEYLLDKMIDQYFSLRSNVCKFFTWILKIYFVSKYWFWWWYLLFLSYKRMIV